MDRWGKAIVVALFALLLVAPGVQQVRPIFAIPPLEEKREKESLPPFDAAGLLSGTFATRFDRFYNDRAGFRDALVRLKNEMDVTVFHVSPNEKVILGKEGWLYFYQTVDDFQKKYSPQTAKELDELCHRLEVFQAGLARRRIDFLLVIVPNKNTLYGQFMPDRYHQPPGPSLCDRLFGELRQRGKVKVLFLKEALQRHESEALLYDPWGTHWSMLGAFYAAREILECLGTRYGLVCSLPKQVSHSYVATRNDLTAMLEGLRGYKKPWPSPDVAALRVAFAEGGKLPRTIWYQDSFTDYLKPYLVQNFTSITFLDFGSEPMKSTLVPHLAGTKLVVLAAVERNVRYMILYYDFPDLAEETPAPAPPGRAAGR